MSVSRETLDALAGRYGLDQTTTERLDRLLDALALEPDPPTTVSDPVAALRVHVADSLSALEVEALTQAASIADVGAGAGFPGLVLAAALPATGVDLIEATRRKCAVIDRLAAAAGIRNARAIPARAEEWGARGGRAAYGAVTARAVGPLAVLAEYAAPLLRQNGVLVAWKGGREPDEERAAHRAASRLGLEVEEVRPVAPFPEARERHLHVIRKVRPTPAGFPRRTGIARKRPLD